MKRRGKTKFQPPDTVSVTAYRNGAELHATVKWADTQLVLQSFLDVFREATKRYPELINDLPHVGGGSIQYQDDWSEGSANRRRKIGF